MHNFRKYFITGLVILLPMAVTIFIVAFIINFLTQPFVGFASRLLSEWHIINKGFYFLSPEQTIKYGSQLLILVILFLFTVGIGMITRWFFFKALIHLGDKILHRIPIVNTVYKTSQDIIKTLFVSDKNSFKQVVLAPYPRAGVYALGLIAREAPPECSAKAEHDLISVLIPTTPNPTTGFLLMYKREDLIFLDMRPEDAIKCIVSCGVIIPGATTTSSPTSRFL